MSLYQAITLDFKLVDEPKTQADFTYSITPTTISIIDTGKGRRSVSNDIESVLRKIEYWHQGSIAEFKIMYRDEKGVWDGVRWDGQHPSQESKKHPNLSFQLKAPSSNFKVRHPPRCKPGAFVPRMNYHPLLRGIFRQLVRITKDIKRVSLLIHFQQTVLHSRVKVLKSFGS
jgi:hypothetical protein